MAAARVSDLQDAKRGDTRPGPRASAPVSTELPGTSGPVSFSAAPQLKLSRRGDVQQGRPSAPAAAAEAVEAVRFVRT